MSLLLVMTDKTKRKKTKQTKNKQVQYSFADE